MNVIIAGQKRSGSTAQYNMVRLVLLEAFGEVNLCGSNFPVFKGINLIKRHSYNHDLYKLASHVFTTTRNGKDVQESMRAFYGHAETIDYTSLYKWRQKSINMEYEEIVNEPLKCIETIINALGVNVCALSVLEKFKAIKPPKEGQDKETLLFSNHRRNEN